MNHKIQFRISDEYGIRYKISFYAEACVWGFVCDQNSADLYKRVLTKCEEFAVFLWLPFLLARKIRIERYAALLVSCGELFYFAAENKFPSCSICLPPSMSEMRCQVEVS
jgi:hypothetical protein